MNEDLLNPIACAGLSHHSADISALENFRYDDEKLLLTEAREQFKGVILLQTCNRVELMVQGSAADLKAFLTGQGRSGFWLKEGKDALQHLLNLAAGIDSMIVGEDQILGQMKKALSVSQQAGTCSSLLELCITKAVHAGVEVRKRTHINNGAVSIGSAAVQLAEELLYSLEGRHILVVGGGEMGKLVTQALAAKNLTAIYVTNRTYEKAVELADEIGGKAVKLDELYRYIALSDVVISCTAAPHPVIHYNGLCKAVEARHWPLDDKPHPLVLIDIAQPRDVEESVRDIAGIHLFTIDDLRSVSEKNLISRKHEAELAHEFLENELEQFISLLNRTAANETLAQLHTWAEAIRVRERDRAVSRLGTSDDRIPEIMDDFSHVLVKKLLMNATFSIRGSAECGEMNYAESLVKAITRGEKLCFRRED